MPGEEAGLVTVWNEQGATISLWRSVLVRLAWEHLPEIERLSDAPVGQGNVVRNPSDELLDAVAGAYRTAAQGQPPWNGTDFYVSFGEGPRRNWDDARDYGFISAGGGEWYSRTLKQLRAGNRIFVYISRGNGVGGYVGVGEVMGDPLLAKDFEVGPTDARRPYPDIARAPEAGDSAEDPLLAEWVVPVRWIETRDREDAVKDSDFFANTHSAARLTHSYTLKKLNEAFHLDEIGGTG